METDALDESRITKEAREFGEALFARFPDFRKHAAMGRRPGEEEWTLVVTVRAPSGDSRSDLVVWVEGGDDPSVAFGGWHTHEELWGFGPEDNRRALLDLIEGILEDRFVTCEDLAYDPESEPNPSILDLSDGDALLEKLTSPYSSGGARLRSWSGRLDRVVILEALNRDIRA